jgi:hypothetical protein
MGDMADRERELEYDQPRGITRSHRVKLGTWQAREVEKVWQKAVFEKAQRLVCLHEAIEATEGRVTLPTNTLITLTLHPGDERIEVTVERGHLLQVMRSEEQEIITDLARILRQVAEP